MNDAPQSQIAPLLDERDVAVILGVTRHALQAWRVRGGGPPFIKVGRCIRYRESDITKWLDSHTCANTSQEVR